MVQVDRNARDDFWSQSSPASVFEVILLALFYLPCSLLWEFPLLSQPIEMVPSAAIWGWCWRAIPSVLATAWHRPELETGRMTWLSGGHCTRTGAHIPWERAVERIRRGGEEKSERRESRKARKVGGWCCLTHAHLHAQPPPQRPEVPPKWVACTCLLRHWDSP